MTDSPANRPKRFLSGEHRGLTVERMVELAGSASTAAGGKTLTVP
jgi:hypothetical protein